MQNNKRAMTAVVATVILVALVIIAIGIVSVVIFDIVGKGSDEAALESKCIGTLFEVDSFTNDTSNYLVKATRIAGSEDIYGVGVTLINSTATNLFNQMGNVVSGGVVIVNIPKSYLVGATSVKVSGYFNTSGKTKYCGPSTEKTKA